MSLLLELPNLKTQHAFNLERWEAVMSDPEVQFLKTTRVETDRNGHPIMSPFASSQHGYYQNEIGYLLRTMLPSGKSLSECPVSTSDGVKLIDVCWYSNSRRNPIKHEKIFRIAPEICVEVISPSNTRREILEKRMLYFELECKEFWTCSLAGDLEFFDTSKGDAIPASKLCPEFPGHIDL